MLAQIFALRDVQLFDPVTVLIFAVASRVLAISVVNAGGTNSAGKDVFNILSAKLTHLALQLL